MKTLKIMVCALFVLCGGLVFAACGKAQDFDAGKIMIDTTSVYTYDGNPHAVLVSYDGVDADVTYALSDDKTNFKPLSELNTSDAGTYHLYFKLSAKGYNDYVSSGTLELTVEQKTLEIILEDYNWIKSNPHNNFQVGYTSIGELPNEDVGLSINFDEEFDENTAEYGDAFNITCSITNPNFKLVYEPAKLFVKDYVHIENNGEISYYSTLQDAIKVAQDGQTVVLNSNVLIDETIDLDKSIKIDGQGKYEIIAAPVFTNATYANKDVASIFNVVNENVELTLKDVTLNGSDLVRGVSAFAGKVIIDGATITNGKKTDKWRSGGVYITRKASFEMTRGLISGNDANDDEYTKYCSDLWIGANAIGSLVSISGGTVGNVFVNSNSYSAIGAGKFVLDGGNIDNVYVEYDSGFGANFEYITGNVNHLKIALINDNCNYYGVSHEITPVENTTYIGGKLVYEESDNMLLGKTYNENIDNILSDEIDYVFENCTFNTALSTTKRVGLVFNNCTFTTNDANGVESLYLTSVTNLIVNNCTFNGITDGYTINLNLYSTNCENVVISNNIFNTTSENAEVAISVKTRLGETDHPTDDWAKGEVFGIILGSVLVAGNDFSETNNKIYIGEDPQGMDTSANLTSGDFEVLIDGNLDRLTIYNKFKDHAFVEEEDKSIVTLLKDGTYSSIT